MCAMVIGETLTSELKQVWYRPVTTHLDVVIAEMRIIYDLMAVQNFLCKVGQIKVNNF